MYATAPLPDASNEVSRISDLVLERGGPTFATNEMLKFVRSPDGGGLDWRGNPYLTPSLQSVTVDNHPYAFASTFPNSPVEPLPHTIIEALNQPDLVYFQRELTGPHIEQWLYTARFVRFVTSKPQLPFDSPSLLWLKTFGLRLGEATTRITRTGPNQLDFSRSSTCGFTALELQLLADWIESARFPMSLHSLD